MTTFPQLLPVSVEFTQLCQQQLRLLGLGIGADWSILYLAQPVQETQEMVLRAISAYPDRFLAEGVAIADGVVSEEIVAEWIETLPTPERELEPNGQGLPGELVASATVFPILHGDLLLGILTTGRRDRAWRSPEISQIQCVNQSVALACVLDQQKSWATQQLNQQRHLQELEQEHFHDLLHQLRNPTMAISTFGKLLKKRLEPEDRNYSVAEGVVRESDRLKSLLHQFGEEVRFIDSQVQAIPAGSTLALPENVAQFSSPYQGQPLTLETLDLRELVLPIVASMGAIAAEQDLQLTVALADNLGQVWGNGNALTEVLNNLLENAIKYTPAGGQICLQGQTGTGHVSLAVHDTGYGIPPQDLPRVFERHYRGVQAGGSIHGTGLGLAIAHELVEKMGGDLEVESPTLGLPHTEKYPGSTFILWLKTAENHHPL